MHATFVTGPLVSRPTAGVNNTVRNACDTTWELSNRQPVNPHSLVLCEEFMRVPLMFIAFAIFSGFATAQTVYKHSDPSGRITYSDDPNPGRGIVTLLEIPPPPSGNSGSGLREADKRLLEQASGRVAKLNRANEDIVAASSALRAAEARSEPGRAPLEGERSGRRYRPEYWERQQALKQEIDQARRSLEEALDRRNAVR